MNDNGLSEVLHIISPEKAQAWREYNARQDSAPVRKMNYLQEDRRNSEQGQGAKIEVRNSDIVDFIIEKTAWNTVKFIVALLVIVVMIRECSGSD